MSTETQPRITVPEEQNTNIPPLPEFPAELAAENNEPQEPAFPYLKHGWNVISKNPDGTFFIEQKSGYDKGPSVTGTSRTVSAEQLDDLIAEDQEAAALDAAARAEADRQKAEEKAYTEAVDAKVALFEALDEDEPSEPAKRSFGRRIIDRLGYEEETGGFTRGDGALVNKLSSIRAERAERRAASTEDGGERLSLRERIANVKNRAKAAAANKLSRTDEKKLLRKQAKADKREAQRDKAQTAADVINERIAVKNYSLMRDEADAMNDLYDDHEDAIAIDEDYNEYKDLYDDAYAMNDTFDEEKLEEERQARIQAQRDAIKAKYDAKANKKLDKVIAKADKLQSKSAAKQEAVTDYGKLRGLRARVAQALRTVTRQ